MTFELFGPATKCDIRVGYISTDRGFVDNVGLYDANQYAKLNPGTQFIFRNREKVQYLNINEVNKLQPESMLPKANAGADGSCGGIVGLNGEGSSGKSIDDSLGLSAPAVGGSTQVDNSFIYDFTGKAMERDTTRVHFYGGGGVGVQANPVVGADGSLMAVDVLHGGFGYQYAPIVDIRDDRGVGSGVVALALVKTGVGGTDYLIEEYDSENDFEEYILDECIPPLEGVGFGKLYGPDGKVIGDWDPGMYIGSSRDPMAKRIDNYQRLLASIKTGGGTKWDKQNKRISEWWTTRQHPPLRVVSPEATTRTKHDVFHWAWGSIPVKNDPIRNLYLELFGREAEPEGFNYWKKLQEQGQSLSQIKEGMMQQPEWRKVQIEGKPVYPPKTAIGGQCFEYDKNNFMNRFAISPISPSNVKGSDMAAKPYTFEWEEDFLWDGDYVFRVQADNEAVLSLDSKVIGPKIELGSALTEGHSLSKPTVIKKFIPAGVHKIRVDIENFVHKEMKKVVENVREVTSNKVKFNITTASLFGALFEISDLGISVEKPYGEGKDVKESFEKTVEFGRVYQVTLKSSAVDKSKQSSNSSQIAFTGLHPRNNPINVTNNRTRLALKDDHGDDTNASFVITKGTLRFSADGKSIEGSGKATLSLSWKDHPPNVAVGSIKIGGKTWTQSGYSGSQSHTIELSPSSSDARYNNTKNIKLRTKGETVLQMEDIPHVKDQKVFYDDVVCSVSQGKFYDINGNTCKFTLNRPSEAPSSTGSDGITTVFNTADWIQKANRQLWKINPGAGKDASFLNKFGVLPFDPTPVSKVEKKVTYDLVKESKATVKFLKEDGKNYMKVTGTGKVKVFFELNVNDRPGISSLALTEIKIKADDGDIILRRDPNRRYANEKGSGEFTAGQKYLVKTIGASSGAGSIISVDKTIIGYDDDYDNGYDENGNLKITGVTPIDMIEKVSENVLGYPDYPNASNDDYAGTHEINWSNLQFPEDGNYSVEIMVDDNVVLTFSHPGREDIVIRKDGFKIRGDGSTATGKSFEVLYFRHGTYGLKAELEQIPGKPLAKGNPMALAVDVKTAFVVNHVEVFSAKSWNQNPMGVAMTIDAPFPDKNYFREPPQLQEGRCPNNPMWTTRDVKNIDHSWYPVRNSRWAKFMNRYAISPIPPLGTDNSDGAGVSYSNTWTVDVPYKGFYGVKASVDYNGKIFIDNQEVIGPNTKPRISLYDSPSPVMGKKFLEAGQHQIRVEVSNDKKQNWSWIDKKIFSTADWSEKQTSTKKVTKGATNVDVTIKASSASLYANNIDIKGLYSVGKAYGDKNQFTDTKIVNVEVGKVYDVEFTSNSQKSKSSTVPVVYKGLHPRNNPINVTNNGTTVKLKDDHGSDTNATITIAKTVGGTVKFTNDGKGFKVTAGVSAERVRTTITMSWKDHPPNVAIDSFSVGDKTWTRSGYSGTVTKDVYIYPPNATENQNNNSNIKLRNKGEQVVQMEDWTDTSFDDLICSASDGKFYDMQGRFCKFTVPSKDTVETILGGGLSSGSVKDGVSYSGPPISTYASGPIGPFITPTWKTDEEYIANFNGKTWTFTWDNVDFPERGTYDIQAAADDSVVVKLDGHEICKAGHYVQDGMQVHMFQATRGKHKIDVILTNLDFQAPFSQNPAVVAIKITKKTKVGTAVAKPWTDNPMGISASLIPPPCPKQISGVGIVTDVVIYDPGNGWTPPTKPGDTTPSYPVNLELNELIPLDTGGINYGPGDIVCIKNTVTGEEECFEPEFGPFGQIVRVIYPPPPILPPEVFPPEPPPGQPPITPLPPPGELPTLPEEKTASTVVKKLSGFTEWPEINVRSVYPKVPTGIGAQFVPKFKIVRDPIGIPRPEQLIQVTDLVGLKRTGFYEGKPYYGAVFYKDGIRFAGYYETPGKLVQIYDTLQESIDATVTTPPSAIQRQGTDINSNDPRLNIPGTPNNLI